MVPVETQLQPTWKDIVDAYWWGWATVAVVLFCGSILIKPDRATYSIVAVGAIAMGYFVVAYEGLKERRDLRARITGFEGRLQLVTGPGRVDEADQWAQVASSALKTADYALERQASKVQKRKS